MDSSVHNYVTNPLGVVQYAFEAALASDFEKAVICQDWGETVLFNNFFSKGGLSQVPLLSSKSVGWLQENTLVRFRGMIRDDKPAVEHYVAASEDGGVWRATKYTDAQKDTPLGLRGGLKIWTRSLFCCIPVPGQNDWTEPSSLWMNLNALGDANELRDHGAPTEGSSSMTTVTSEVDIENLSCLVKMYHSPDPYFKLNVVYDFVGILSFDQEFVGILALNPPPGKEPRLHCVGYRKISPGDFFPRPESLERTLHLVKPVRESLLAHLTTLLGNDDVAAQFMLLHLVSSVRERKDTVVEKLAVNLTSLTSERLSVFKNRILSLLKHLLPYSHDLPPLTAELLNAGHLAPQKDESIRVSGVLQLANESHLTIDETQLKAGSLNSIGKCNVAVLRSLLECQKEEYDFSNHKKGVPTDVQLLIFSEGNSEIFPADQRLPFHPSSVGSPKTPTADILGAWREYLAITRSLTYSIDFEMMKVVIDDMAAASKIDPQAANEDFSRMITMAQLITSSFGETSLSMERWQMVKELRRLRRERLQGL